MHTCTADQSRHQADDAPAAPLPGVNAVPWSSQLGQDHLVHTLLGADHKGLFIDLASNDPIALSNTRALETLGYRGLCIEPNPVYYPLYKLARRRCTLVPYAVSAKRGTVPFVSRKHAKKNNPLAALGDERWAAMFGGIVAPGLDNAKLAHRKRCKWGIGRHRRQRVVAGRESRPSPCAHAARGYPG